MPQDSFANCGIRRKSLSTSISSAIFQQKRTPRESAPGATVSLHNYRELGIDSEPATARADLPPFDDAMCAVVEYERPEVVSFHFGLPDPALLARIQAVGCRVMSSATRVKEAIWLEAWGVDVIIAQGSEAGGALRHVSGYRS